MRSLNRVAVALIAAGLFACGGGPSPYYEEDLGPLDATLDRAVLKTWPGRVRADGTRAIPLLNGFFDGAPVAYWYGGFASRSSADMFFVCRDGDTKCPFGDNGRVDPSRALGHPVFSRIPGERTFSPYWMIWVVFVPAEYQADDLKSVSGIERESAAGRVRVEQLVHDHGGAVGPEAVIMHALPVLEGTLLENNGGEVVGSPGKTSAYLPVDFAWHKQYRVSFYDFTPNDGLLPPDSSSDSRPLTPTADMYIPYRDCAGGVADRVCQAQASSGGIGAGAVDERALGVDLTGDGDDTDGNAVLSGLPGARSKDPQNRPYSPLWRLNRVKIPAAHDGEVELIDRSRDQGRTTITDTLIIRDLVSRGVVLAPELVRESEIKIEVFGNDGIVLLNCTVQAPMR